MHSFSAQVHTKVQKHVLSNAHEQQKNDSNKTQIHTLAWTQTLCRINQKQNKKQKKKKNKKD